MLWTTATVLWKQKTDPTVVESVIWVKAGLNRHVIPAVGRAIEWDLCLVRPYNKVSAF